MLAGLNVRTNTPKLLTFVARGFTFDQTTQGILHDAEDLLRVQFLHLSHQASYIVVRGSAFNQLRQGMLDNDEVICRGDVTVFACEIRHITSMNSLTLDHTTVLLYLPVAVPFDALSLNEAETLFSTLVRHIYLSHEVNVGDSERVERSVK